MLRRVKLRVRPDRRQLGITNIVGIAGILDIHRITYHRQLTGLGIRLASIRPGYVIDC